MACKMGVNLGGLQMANPVTTASGTFAAGREYSDFYKLSSLGAVTTKGVSLNAWAGNDSPRIAETPSGMLNSIGLQNPGVEAFCAGPLKWLAEQDVPVIVNVSGHSLEEYVSVIERLEDEPAVSAYEVNISCPNVDAGGMTFGTDPELAAEVTRLCRAATKRPMIIKLTPNVTDVTLIAKHVVDAGALRMVWQVHNAVDVPILGMGGIMDANDAIEFMLCGATAVAVGTANFVNPSAGAQIAAGIAEYCDNNGIKDVNELVGALEV